MTRKIKAKEIHHDRLEVYINVSLVLELLASHCTAIYASVAAFCLHNTMPAKLRNHVETLLYVYFSGKLSGSSTLHHIIT